VQPAHATDAGDGWQITIWMVQGRDLVRHELGIASGAAVSDRPSTVEQGIPVPYST
jgi:hypothetical protein